MGGRAKEGIIHVNDQTDHLYSNEWSVRDAQSLMAILKAWKDVAPDFVLDNVLYQLVLPKIEREVNAWNPRVDREPIHSWLFPWLSHLYDDIRLLFPAIRHKMGKALEDWDPLADSSALAVLAPWHDVFERSDYDALLLKSVVPKLSLMLRSFEINPADQKLGRTSYGHDACMLIILSRSN